MEMHISQRWPKGREPATRMQSQPGQPVFQGARHGELTVTPAWPSNQTKTSAARCQVVKGPWRSNANIDVDELSLIYVQRFGPARD